jgi:hypothetical protein
MVRRGLTRIRGPTREANRLKKLNTPRNTPKRPHVSQLEEEVDQPSPQGFGRTDLWAVDPRLPRGCHSLVQGSVLEVLSWLLSESQGLLIEEVHHTFITHNFASLFSLLVPSLGSSLE